MPLTSSYLGNKISLRWNVCIHHHRLLSIFFVRISNSTTKRIPAGFINNFPTLVYWFFCRSKKKWNEVYSKSFTKNSYKYVEYRLYRLVVQFHLNLHHNNNSVGKFIYWKINFIRIFDEYITLSRRKRKMFCIEVWIVLNTKLC